MNKEDQVIGGFRELLNKMSSLNKVKMEKALQEYKPSEVHCIEYIAKNDDCNVTKLSDAFFMTRSAISKLMKKLMEKGYVDSYQKHDNKKEIYFTLTKKGEEISEVHDNLHREFQERDKVVFDEISAEQLEGILSFIDKYNKHLDLEIKKSNINNK